MPRSRRLTHNEVRDLASFLICDTKPPANLMLPALATPLSSSDPLARARAARILGSISNGDQRVIELLVQAYNDADPSASLAAFTALNSYTANVEDWISHFLAWLTSQDCSSKPLGWATCPMMLLEKAGPKARGATPWLLRWLNDGNRIGVNDPAFCSGVVALTAIGSDVPDTLSFLEGAFNVATNWEVRLVLATSLLKVDGQQSQALRLLTDAWVNETNGWRWLQISNTLARAHFDVQQLPEPVRFRPAPMSEWLALGNGLGSISLGPSHSDWMAHLGTKEPEFEGYPLSRWLLDPDPKQKRSSLGSSVTPMITCAQQQLSGTKTNCIPWLLKWLETPSPENTFLVRRGFALLEREGLVALPALTELAQSDQCAIRKAVYDSMKPMKPNWDQLWPALIPALHHPNLEIRLDAARHVCLTFPQQARESGVYQCLPLVLREEVDRRN
ncbi:MAG TPA: HEAT repeat domain-containing protein [Clostridia bacterium]|nr:HEAT repeat domain-containing protein [Clostridia bacterium]